MTLDVIKPDDPDYHKPLDVLIEDLGHADAGRQYGDVIITVEDLTDVLHYLQTYQRIEDEYEELKDWWAEEYVTNEPLSWEQLKQMEGKPVWIELLNHGMWDDPSHRVDSEWWVIGEVRKDDIILATYLDEMELFEDDLGVIWQAYRKERE